MKKTIVIADDHAFVASGMGAALERAGACDIIGTARNGIEAISLIKQLKPDCAVIDLVMPGASGIEVLLECKRWSPKTRIVVLTGSVVPAQFQEIKNAGAHGIFVKSGDPEETCAGIHAVARGATVLGNGVDDLLKEAEQSEKLTGREIEVLIGLSRGFSNQGISQQLGISPKTIDSHRTSLMRKMGVNSTASLLVKAMRDGLI